ncbi:MAG: hypothetical protein ACLPVF_07865 [Acidimicrobiales bacterium]
MPNLRTMVTELGTGLGMLGGGDLDQALHARSPVMRSLSPEDWDLLASARAGGAYGVEFHAAWENGRAFLAARDGLRGRLPAVVEWKGAVRASGDEVAPVDLRVDHVYLVSCKYLSNILFNVAPAHIFDELLVGGQSRRGRQTGGDWYADVAPGPYQCLYDVVRAATRDMGAERPREPAGRPPRRAPGTEATPALPGLGTGGDVAGEVPVEVPRPSWAALPELPPRALDLTTTDRAALASSLRGGWPDRAKAAYRELSAAVAQASVTRWRAALAARTGAREAMLWRLLRMGSAPYFVLGSSPRRSLRLRVATPWDWRQLYALDQLEVFAQEGGQPKVGWQATVRERSSGRLHEVAGHVEVRWSHGRFGGPPEAKGYLDSPHHLVPGYFPLR